MEHESEVVRRRVGRIADHVAGGEEAAAHPRRQVLPMNCSNTLDSVIRRHDSKLFFARQCSTSQACFMRQVSVTQGLKAGSCLQQNSPNNSLSSGNGSSSNGCSGEPQFARPAQALSSIPNLKNYQPVTQEGMPSSTEPPKFAQPGTGQCEKKQLLCERTGQASSGGMEWSPRMDVAEMGKFYIVTLELPGANVIDVKVEVDDKNLIVAGKRSAPGWRMEYRTENGNMTYHRREIFQGPYLVTWPLPNDVNKDSVSAELLTLIRPFGNPPLMATSQLKWRGFLGGILLRYFQFLNGSGIPISQKRLPMEQIRHLAASRRSVPVAAIYFQASPSRQSLVILD